MKAFMDKVHDDVEQMKSNFDAMMAKYEQVLFAFERIVDSSTSITHMFYFQTCCSLFFFAKVVAFFGDDPKVTQPEEFFGIIVRFAQCVQVSSLVSLAH